jgi:hypothetical protein
MKTLAEMLRTTPSGYNLSIKMQDYYFWVENGRKPTQGGGDGELYKISTSGLHLKEIYKRM